jgi:hypothetical protein
MLNRGLLIFAPGLTIKDRLQAHRSGLAGHLPHVHREHLFRPIKALLDPYNSSQHSRFILLRMENGEKCRGVFHKTCYATA